MRRPASSSSAASTNRALADLVREGVVHSVDLDAGKAVVRLGDVLTPPIDWHMPVGDTTLWLPPTEGQPVTVVSPEGDPERAYIAASLPSSSMAPLFLGVRVGIRFRDGSLLSYDPEAKRLQFDLQGSAELVAPDGLSIRGDVAIEGDLDIQGDAHASGKVTGDDDVVFAGKSAKGHKHIGVTAGSAVSGGPQ